jgi:nucleotide-binding universal stress UspA family protein
LQKNRDLQAHVPAFVLVNLFINGSWRAARHPPGKENTMSTRHLIVVGVDGSDGGRRALDWAVREADAHGSAVQAVTAWYWDGPEIGPATATDAWESKAHATRLLDDEVRAVIARHGARVPIAAEVIQGSPALVLAAAGCSGDLLVLGSHGHGRVRRTVLGSVSEEVIHQASCPVVVIPVPAPQRSEEIQRVRHGRRSSQPAVTAHGRLFGRGREPPA